jgi:hypothetical protein
MDPLRISFHSLLSIVRPRTSLAAIGHGALRSPAINSRREVIEAADPRNWSPAKNITGSNRIGRALLRNPRRRRLSGKPSNSAMYPVELFPELIGFVSRSESDRRVSAMIRKLKSGCYRLYSRKKNAKTGRRRNLGTFKTRAAAEKHERAVQYFKRG